MGGPGCRCVRQGFLSAFAVIGQKAGRMRADGRNVDRGEWLSKNCVHFTKPQQCGCHCFQGLFEWLCPLQLPLVYTVGQYCPFSPICCTAGRCQRNQVIRLVQIPNKLSKSEYYSTKLSSFCCTVYKRDNAWNNIVTCQYCHLRMVH